MIVAADKKQAAVEVLMDVNSTPDYYMKCVVSETLELGGFTVQTYPYKAYRAAVEDGRPRIIVHFHSDQRQKAVGVFLAVVVAEQLPGDYISVNFSRSTWRVLDEAEWRFAAEERPEMTIRNKVRDLADKWAAAQRAEVV